MERIKFNHKMVALIVRGKRSAQHDPGIGSHADCVLPGGEPVGYFGARGAETGGEMSASWHSVGLNQKGQVINYAVMKRALKYYTAPKMRAEENFIPLFYYLRLMP